MTSIPATTTEPQPAKTSSEEKDTNEAAKKVAAEEEEKEDNRPELAKAAVLGIRNEEMPEGTPTVKGVDFFSGPPTLEGLLKGLRYSGFQASHVGLAIEEINKMISWRMTAKDIPKGEEEDWPAERVTAERCTIFLGMTSNMISGGTREVIRFLAQNNMIDCIVTTGGAIEEDFMKCFAPHYHGAFKLDGATLRKKGLNRIGNLIVPNNNYVKFENWATPIFMQMLKEQKEQGIVWTPSKMIRRMGKEINNEESVWYWCYKNNIPVYCPAITDGAVGDVLFFMAYNNPGFVVDIAGDIIGVNKTALEARQTGMIILGGGVVKHHICNANLMRNGADYTVFINTGQEFDGSDSGARPDEAVSWGKIKLGASKCKVYGDATVMFPLVVAGSFAQNVEAARRPTTRDRVSLTREYLKSTGDSAKSLKLRRWVEVDLA